MKDVIYHIFYALFSVLPLKKRKIFFLSYYGCQYGCNPKYLSEYVTYNCKDWDVVWGFTEPKKYKISGIRKVRYLSIRYFYELYTSQVFVTNYRMTEHYRKRKGQLYVQTWHSSLRLKKIEGDAEETLSADYIEMAKKDSLHIDVLLSGCQFSSEIFKRAFWYTGLIMPTGTPREDLMFSKGEDIVNKVLKELDIAKDEKTILYAPTFRKGNDFSCYDVDFNRLQMSLSKKFGGEWTILLRLHPHLKGLSRALLRNNRKIIDVTEYDDIQELLLASNIVISDYSSLIFDFALILRPCFLYVSDLDDYVKNDRALYFNIRDLPFPICQNNDTLNSQILNFDISQYRQDVLLFLQKIGSYETGHACRNVVNYIEERIAYEK